MAGNTNGEGACRDDGQQDVMDNSSRLSLPPRREDTSAAILPAHPTEMDAKSVGGGIAEWMSVNFHNAVR